VLRSAIIIETSWQKRRTQMSCDRPYYRVCRCLLFFRDTTSNSSRAAGGNKTDLSTRRRIPLRGRGFTDVLVVTTTVRVLDRVHRNTSDLRPAVTLGLILVEGTSGLKHWLVETTATTNNTNHSPASGLNNLLRAGRQTDTRGSIIQVVRNNRSVVSGGTSNFSTVSLFLLHVANNGTFRHSRKRKNVSNLQLSFDTAEQELSSVDAFSGDEIHFLEAVFVRVAEDNAGNRGATSWVMDNVFNNSLDEPMSFGKVKSTMLDRTLAVLRM